METVAKFMVLAGVAFSGLLLVLSGILSMAMPFIVVYVAWHFLSKFW